MSGERPVTPAVARAQAMLMLPIEPGFYLDSKRRIVELLPGSRWVTPSDWDGASYGIAASGPFTRLVALSDEERDVLLDAIETAAVDWSKPGARGTAELRTLVALLGVQR